MFHIRYCAKCQMPIELGEDARPETRGKETVYSHKYHAITSEEAAEIYVEAFSQDSLWFGGIAKQKLQ